MFLKNKLVPLYSELPEMNDGFWNNPASLKKIDETTPISAKLPMRAFELVFSIGNVISSEYCENKLVEMQSTEKRMIPLKFILALNFTKFTIIQSRNQVISHE